MSWLDASLQGATGPAGPAGPAATGTVPATASTIVERGGSGEVYAAYLAANSTGIAQSGLVRLPTASTAVAFRAASGSVDVSGLAIDSSDVVHVGDAARPTIIDGTSAQVPSTLALANSFTAPAILIVSPTPGTGDRNGIGLQILGQPGQAQTGSNNNTNGGNVLAGGGPAGVGGSGAPGVQGDYEIQGTNIRIGTMGQAIGLYGVTPVAQPSSTGDTTQTHAGSGSPVLVDSTTNGGTGSTAYTFSDVVRAMKQVGILAS